MFDLTSSILEARFGRMVESLEKLCGNMTLSKGEKVGIIITEDAIANLRPKAEGRRGKGGGGSVSSGIY